MSNKVENKKKRISIARASYLTLHHGYAAYPVELIDVIQEQTLVVAHDSVVFQFHLSFSLIFNNPVMDSANYNFQDHI